MPDRLGYLDHAATTPMRPEATAAMLPWLGERFGNPSGGHRVAQAARTAIDEARDVVADCLGCSPREVVFTGGGTEADNLAVFGATGDGLAVCGATEHHAVLHAVEHLGGRTVPVHADGRIRAEEIPVDASLVSVMLVNNEVGTINRLPEVDVVLHTDAVQSVTWLDVASLARAADLVSVTGHKIGGPQGTGALVVREGTALRPLLVGGGQEQERRSGTHNVAGIAGFAAALRACTDGRDETVERVGKLRDRLADGLLASVAGVTESGTRDTKVAGICSLLIEDIESEALLFLLDDAGICATAASSCASGALEPSHVLAAMGVPRELAKGSLRLSLGWSSTDADVDLALDVIPRAVAQLRSCPGRGCPAMRILVAMSGGVDSSVAAAMLRDEGHDVTGVTLKLWGGPSDAGCCSVADVDDARRVAQQLGIHHVVFGFADEFMAGVVAPYVEAHRAGRTPNPCIECNRTIKFDRLLRRADQLGFDAIATGHHARAVDGRLLRGADRAKDQSYVLHMLDRSRLRRIRFPVGELTKDDVRARAVALGLRTAAKPDSQEVCFLPGGGRDRSALVESTRGQVIEDGAVVGSVPAVELVTVGQRRGLGLGGSRAPRYVLDVDVATATVTVGPLDALLTDTVRIADASWVDGEPDGEVQVQASAHGRVTAGWYRGGVVRFAEPVRRIAPGQSVVLYDGDEVLGGGMAR